MAIPYIETFYIGGNRYGIEDHDDGQPDHFFKRDNRYHAWLNGCGIGTCETLPEIRQLICSVPRTTD